MAIFQFFFQNGGCPPSGICYMRVSTTHKEYLQVFVTVQCLVGFVAVIFRFLKMAAAAILDFRNLKFLTVGMVKRI